MRWLLAAFALLALLLVACNDRGAKTAQVTGAPALATLPQPRTVTPRARPSAREIARQVEADDDPSLPGEYVDLPRIYGGYYGNQDGTNTGAHLRETIDYNPQGLPPAGGPHWSGACPPDPSQAQLYCGPAPWGIYRSPWHAESLVHNMEHAGVIVWYNTTDQSVIDHLEAFATQHLSRGMRLVLTPYPNMDAETMAITVWSRRDKFPVSEYDPARLQKFIDALYCRFDPEGFCNRAPTPRPTSGPSNLV